MRSGNGTAKTFRSREGEPGYKGLLGKSSSEAYFGHLKRSEEVARQLADTASAEGDKATAAGLQEKTAFNEAVFGDPTGASRHAAAALSLDGKPTAELALAGDLALATNVVDRPVSDSPPDSLAAKASPPESRAAIELKRGNPNGAVQFLATVGPTRWAGMTGFYPRTCGEKRTLQPSVAPKPQPKSSFRVARISMSHPRRDNSFAVVLCR